MSWDEAREWFDNYTDIRDVPAFFMGHENPNSKTLVMTIRKSWAYECPEDFVTICEILKEQEER